MKRLAFLALAACSGNERVLLQLNGDIGPVDRIDVIVAEPLTFARMQRTNEPVSTPASPAVERVYYIGQRGAAELAFTTPQSTAGLQIQLDAGDTTPYLPIVVAHHGDEIVGMGVFAPEHLFPDPQSTSAVNSTGQVVYKADITLYEIDMQAVQQQNVRQGNTLLPVFVNESQLLAVKCGEQLSGYVWRPDDADPQGRSPELRIVLPLDEEDANALGRFDRGPDLDCDMHTAERKDPGDELDCDDTTSTTFGGTPHESCNGVDDDCDGMLGGAMVVAHDCTNSCSTARVCDDLNPTPGGTCASSNCFKCKVPNVPDIAGTTRTVCKGLSAFQVPLACPNCIATLIDADPRWTVLIGTPSAPSNGLNQPFMLPPDVPLGILADPDPAQAIYPIGTPDGGSFTVFFRPGPGMAGFSLAFQLEIQTNLQSGCIVGAGQSMDCL